MKQMIERLRAVLFHAWERAAQTMETVFQTTRRRIRSDRVSHTRFVYAALSVGTVALAFLLILLNMGVFALAERGLYDRETYETVHIVSAGGIADPLPRKQRVELFIACKTEGVERATLPEERSRTEAIAEVQQLWTETLQSFADGSGRLRTGESVERLLNGSKYTATLRDFYDESTGAKLALWSVQAYYRTSSNRIYCLSAELDSRTNDVYSMSIALFENIIDTAASDFYPILHVLGEPTSVADQAISTPTDTGTVTTLILSDGIHLTRETTIGSQIVLTLGLDINA